jgi:asparagine synthase (glutamine-hydrolysing)
MAVQFGLFNLDGKPVDRRVVEDVEALLAPYSPDGISIVHQGSVAILYGCLETARVIGQAQPFRLTNQDWMMWDGRLDNRTELGGGSAGQGQLSTDVGIVANAYERLGTRMFSQLIGDWAIGIFSEARKEIVLARDFLGTRPLFYRADQHQLAWSTVLDPLFTLGNGVPNLSRPYLAGWMSSFPGSHLTPYEGVWSVPPSCFVRIRAGHAVTQKYWEFDRDQQIRHRNDREYEEHFYSVFREAVHRRMYSSTPILAELSGGMDSSSIVCVADSLFASGHGPAPRLDTVTYFDLREPNWDELPYAHIVEQNRGRAGSHIDVGPESFDSKGPIRRRLQMIPTSLYARSAAADTFSQLLSDGGYRVVLSGLGGDEFLGGVPTPIPELADLLVSLDLTRFLRQSFKWASAKRKPIFTLWSTVLLQFLPRRSSFSRQAVDRLTWLTDAFSTGHYQELCFPARRTRLMGGSPSFQANLAVIESLRSQLSCVALESSPPYEWRYPFLDRDLVSFCISIPREQMVRPNERRSLMRRALATVVPPEILQRTRKAYVSRALVKVLGTEYRRLLNSGPFIAEELGILDSRRLELAVRDAEQGRDVATLTLHRTLGLENWLRGLREYEGHLKPRFVSGACDIRAAHRPHPQLLGREN